MTVMPSFGRRRSAALFTALFALTALGDPAPAVWSALAPCPITPWGGPSEAPKEDEAVKDTTAVTCRRLTAAPSSLRPPASHPHLSCRAAPACLLGSPQRLPCARDFPLRC